MVVFGPTRTGVPLASVAIIAAAALLTVSGDAFGQETTPKPRRFGLVIGNNQPEPTSSAATLRYADDDALSTHTLLLEAEVESVLLARFDSDTRRMHPDAAPAGPPRARTFDRAIAELFARMRAAVARGERPELLVFYSGHGDVAAGEGYVVLEDRRLTRTELHALLARSPAARNHVFIDACKSYFIAFERGPGGQRASYRGPLLDLQPGRLENVGFVLSTSSDRDSHEWEQYQGGILSHELRSALRGGADADNDGRVTYAELGAFLSSANAGIANPRFRPDFLVRPPGRNVREEVLRWPGVVANAIARPSPGQSSTIRLDLRADAHVYVEDARGDRVVDVHPSATQALTLRVPAARPMFVRRNDESAEAVIEEEGHALVATLEPRTRTVVSKGALDLAFQQLFAVAFEAQTVDAFERRGFPALGDTTDGNGARGVWARRVAAGATAAAVAAGLTLNGLAYMRYRDGAGASQRDIDAANRSIRRLNVASIICYGAAALAGASWAWLAWGVDVSVGEGDRREASISLRTTF